ncbi:MAG: hypothetical protein KDK39_10930 [Leptospiraceae bacterium]|nr:hypothetical protein [Leptospiraceae bacterium]
MEDAVRDQFIDQEINVAINLMLQQDSISSLKLKCAIPRVSQYPWEVFLELNFSREYNPLLKPFDLSFEDFNANHEIDDTRKPKNFLDMFKFMEFMRQQFSFIETQIPVIERKFMHFRFRAKQILDSNQIDQKELQKNIQNTLIEAYNMVSQRGPLQNLYKKVIEFVNTEIAQKGEFNFKRLYGLRTIEQEFNPDFGVLVRKARELLLTRRKLERILDKWSSISVPPDRA